jgi:transcriptional regulator with XRE-family HTH domain
MEVQMERLAKLREDRALTLRGLAKISGVDANTINQIELGHRKPRPSTTRKLATALGVSVEELERPVNWLSHYLEQEAEHAAHLVETAARVRETLEAGQFEFTARFLEILDEGLRNLSESLYEAHRIETGKEKTTTAEKSIDDKLSELLREYEEAMTA